MKTAPGQNHSHSLQEISRKLLAASLVLISIYMVVELVGGILSSSLALIADAGHMLADGASIALALAAIHLARRPATAERTFGLRRIEILAALANALALWLVSAWIIYEAIGRLQSPPEVQGELVLAIGTGGLILNLVVAKMLHAPAQKNINIEGTFHHVIADLLGSAGVVVSGVLIWAFGWTLSDLIASLVIGILVAVSAWKLLAKVIHVLLEGTPKDLDIRALCRQIENLDSVATVYDVHAWTISPDYNALTAHVLVEKDHDDTDALLGRIRAIAKDFGIEHTTIQIDKSLEDWAEGHPGLLPGRIDCPQDGQMRGAFTPDACIEAHVCNEHAPDHAHGPGCGHEAISHEDHVDYLVGDHLHHPHGDHCDHHGRFEAV